MCIQIYCLFSHFLLPVHVPILLWQCSRVGFYAYLANVMPSSDHMSCEQTQFSTEAMRCLTNSERMGIKWYTNWLQGSATEHNGIYKYDHSIVFRAWNDYQEWH